jgi:tetratricopeptide (TPR) repeat protein
MKTFIRFFVLLLALWATSACAQPAGRDPQVEALLKPVIALAQAGKFQSAEIQCTRVINRHPRAASAYTLRANMRLQQQKTGGALEDANQAIRLAPDWSGGRISRAMILLALGRPDPALQDLEIGILKAKNDPAQAKEYRLALYYRSDYLIKHGQLEPALHDLNRILQSKPDQMSALYSRGTVLIQLGRFELAEKDLSQVIASGLQGPPLAGAFTSLAQAQANLGWLDRALESVDQALAITGDNPFMHGVRGQILQKKGLHDQAVQAFSRAIELEPRYLEAVQQRGDSLMVLGRYARAAEDYGLLIMRGQKYTDKVKGHLMRAKSFLGRRMYQEAMDDLEQVIRLLPAKELGYAELARLLAGCPEAGFRNGDKALQLARKAVKIRQVPDTLAVLAAAQAESGDFRNAVQTQLKAITMLIRGNAPQTAIDYYERQLKGYQERQPFRLQAPNPAPAERHEGQRSADSGTTSGPIRNR